MLSTVRPFTSLTTLAGLGLVLLATTVAQAQAPAAPPAAPTVHVQKNLDRVEVAMWPEYDKPSVLVIVRAWVPADAKMPAMVPVKIPARAGMPHAVAKRAPDGTLLLAQHTREVDGEWATINVVTDVQELRVEYYTDLKAEATARNFTYEWPAALQVGKFTYEVQQPAGATAFAVTPPSAQQGAGNDGLIYHRADLGKLLPTDAAKIEVSYTKTTPGLTVAALQPSSPNAAIPNVPPPPTPPTTPKSDESSTWIVVVLVGLLVAIGGAWVALSGKKEEEDSSKS